MADEEQLRILKQGVKVWNKWRKENIVIKIDLRHADLWKADLGGADLSGADLYDANLRDADLRGAHLDFANLTSAALRNADISDADFLLADISLADLQNVNLEDAVFGYTKLLATDMAGARNLHTIRHMAPSSLDYGTIEKSGDLPVEFLRGCGWPDFMINALNDQKGKGIEFYSCFISYSSKDDEFARKLHADLQDNGIRCWFAPHDMKTGARMWETIDEAIRTRDKTLLILSEDSIKSDWVRDEVETAFAEERKKKKDILFPIRIDNSVMDTDKPWATKLRDNRHIGDFRDWKNDIKYNLALEKLIDHLKSGKVSG